MSYLLCNSVIYYLLWYYIRETSLSYKDFAYHTKTISWAQGQWAPWGKRALFAKKKKILIELILIESYESGTI